MTTGRINQVAVVRRARCPACAVPLGGGEELATEVSGRPSPRLGPPRSAARGRQKSPPRAPRAILLPTLVITRAASAAQSPSCRPLFGGARGAARPGGPVRRPRRRRRVRQEAPRHRRRGGLQMLYSGFGQRPAVHRAHPAAAGTQKVHAASEWCRRAAVARGARSSPA